MSRCCFRMTRIVAGAESGIPRKQTGSARIGPGGQRIPTAQLSPTQLRGVPHLGCLLPRKGPLQHVSLFTPIPTSPGQPVLISPGRTSGELRLLDTLGGGGCFFGGGGGAGAARRRRARGG